MPSTTACKRSTSALISVRIPQTFFPFTSRSFGQRMSTVESGDGAYRFLRRQARHQRQHGSGSRRKGRPQDDGRVNAAGFFREPGAAQAAPPGSLLLRHHHGSVLGAFRRELERHSVGGVGAEVMNDIAADGVIAQFRPQQAGREDVGDRHQLISFRLRDSRISTPSERRLSIHRQT